MGGSGGGFFEEHSSKGPGDIIEQIKREQEQAKAREFENNVNQLISDTLKSANNRDVEAVNSHIDTMIKALNKEIDGNVQTMFGGSVAKHTYVDGLSDVDVLVVLNNSGLSEKSPSDISKYFVERLKTRLPQTEINAGKLAISVRFSDGVEIQLLPSIKTDTGVKIAKANGEDWSKVVNPGKFAEKLVKVNQACNGKVVPVIKLAKSIMSELPDKRQMSGYHIESMAVAIFSNYSGEKTSKAMLKHFFEKAVTRVLSPIKDKTGQTVNTDAYMGSKDSVQRKAVSDSLSGIARRIGSAERSGRMDQWKEIL
ncbi:MAG: CBASS oligonucleotide cyclase [Imperialibacter sp.]|uniref:CBASS oligonucleotide cyclase n=1 Tax=Imperialibacter sp. TaxID=2038411 RepID=UPI0032EBB6B7